MAVYKREQQNYCKRDSSNALIHLSLTFTWEDLFPLHLPWFLLEQLSKVKFGNTCGCSCLKSCVKVPAVEFAATRWRQIAGAGP